MIPLHGESIRHQMVMLGTGLEILNRVIDIQIGEKRMFDEYSFVFDIDGTLCPIKKGRKV